MTISSDSCQPKKTRNGSPNSAQPLPIPNIEKPRNRTVWECFEAHQGRQIDKWAHYFPIYERHFATYVGKPVRVLEIGVDHGGSLQLWKAYFGPQAQIMGIDIDIRCCAYEEPQIEVFHTNQRNPPTWIDWDIVIDDGSHLKADQEASFKALWPATRGVYLIEDCHSGFPEIAAPDGVQTLYPWVSVIERPRRMIKGTPSRELNPDEVAARHLYGA
jgi:hypothetical protein